MGRNYIEIDKDELKKKLKELPTQNAVADFFNVSQGTISNKVRDYGLGAIMKPKTPKDKFHEMPDWDENELKNLLYNLEDSSAKTIGYNEVDIEIETETPIEIASIADPHIGARHVEYRRFWKTVMDIRDIPNMFTTLNGDYADNYNTSAYKSGQIEQQLPIQKQKAIVEWFVKQLSPKTLSIINGCHDDWSYLNDGFDFAKYLAHKSRGYYLGHSGLINLKVGDVTYRILVVHNTFRNSTLNPGHGLRSVAKEGVDFDIGIGAHIHKPHFEQFVLRGELKTIMICGTFKLEDRHASKEGFPPLLSCTPGIILNPKEFEVIGHIDYRKLVKYL